MEQQPKGGFDSHEVSDGLLNNNDNSKEHTILRKESQDVITELGNMFHKYGEKLTALKQHVKDIGFEMVNTKDKEELEALEKESEELQIEWQKISDLRDRIENFIFGDKDKTSLN